MPRSAIWKANADERLLLADFYHRVCELAEQNMIKTGKLEGSHYAAMQQVLAEWGVFRIDAVKSLTQPR